MAEYYAKGKTNWPKLILIYLVVGGIVYYMVYYFFLKPGGAYVSPSSAPYLVPSTAPVTSSAPYVAPTKAPSATKAPSNPYSY
ncbi:MAG TPA: hypothetical protein VKC54_02850 [Patescibacteria group bacterium]|nr:hypothetical protein [Patescibacteria group bacterium]